MLVFFPKSLKTVKPMAKRRKKKIKNSKIAEKAHRSTLMSLVISQMSNEVSRLPIKVLKNNRPKWTRRPPTTLNRYKMIKMIILVMITGIRLKIIMLRQSRTKMKKRETTIRRSMKTSITELCNLFLRIGLILIKMVVRLTSMVSNK